MRVAPLDFVPDEKPKLFQDDAILKWRRGLIHAIKKRDIVEVTLLVNSPDPTCDILELLNASEPLEITGEKPSKDNDPKGGERLKLPIIIAAIYGDIDILELLFQKGADIYNKDANGDNVIHAIVMVAAFKPSRERTLCQVYRRLIELAVTDEGKMKLLHAENCLGLRPLELAAKHGTFLLLISIVETEGVYRSVISETTTSEIIRYELSEYECFGLTQRRHLTPLQFLRRALVSDLEKEGINETFRHPLFRKWISSKLHEIRLVIIVPFFLSVFLVASFGMMDEYGHSELCPANKTVPIINIHSGVKRGIFYWSVLLDNVLKLFGVVFSIRGYYKAHGKYGRKRFRRSEHEFGKGACLVSNTTFSVFYILNAFEMLSYMIVMMTVPGWQYGQTGELMLIARITIEISLWWLLLYYIQIMPGIGYLVIGAFRCIDIFAYFLLIFLLFFAASVEGMRSVARYYCLDKIGYSFDSVYSTFLIMLNMINTRDLNDNQTGTPFAVVLMHTHVVFILVILLVNFLIALLSEEIGKIERHKTIIGALTRLNVSLDVLAIYDGVYDLLPRCMQRQRKQFFIEHEEFSL
jgi:hypothetical protein